MFYSEKNKQTNCLYLHHQVPEKSMSVFRELPSASLRGCRVKAGGGWSQDYEGAALAPQFILAAMKMLVVSSPCSFQRQVNLPSDSNPFHTKIGSQDLLCIPPGPSAQLISGQVPIVPSACVIRNLRFRSLSQITNPSAVRIQSNCSVSEYKSLHLFLLSPSS